MNEEAAPRILSTGEATLLIDSSGTIIAWSDGAHALLGYRASEMVGRPIGDLLASQPPEIARHGWALRAAFKATVLSKHRGGYRMDLVVHGQPLSSASGDVLWLFTANSLDSRSPQPVLGQKGGTGEQHWARRRLHILNQAGVRIGTTLGLSRTAEELAEVATDCFADFATVDLLDAVRHGDDIDAFHTAGSDRLVTFRRTAQRSVLPGCPEAVISVGGEDTYPVGSPPGLALATGRGSRHLIDDACLRWWAAGVPSRVRSVRTYGMHSMMMVPLRARGVPLGLAMFFRHQTLEPFGEDDLLMAEELGARAAVCIDNARRYARERTTALTLQRSLLPQRAPEQTAVDVATRYLPAGSRAGVGGDWYDVIPLSGARVALVAGDVVGHGLQASATMGRLRTAVRTLADVDLAPDELLTQLDDVVLRLESDEARLDSDQETSATGETIATCVYVVYDPVSRRCAMASAGHLPPAIVSPDGSVRFCDLPAGPPLGLGGLPFEAVEFDVPEGSLLVLYTDGLVERPDHDLDTGLSVMCQILGVPLQSLEETCDLLLEGLLPERPFDDVALLLARTRGLGSGQVASWDLSADPSIVSEARRNACDQLVGWGLDDAVFTTELIVSELVTNAIRYGGSRIQLRLIRDTTLICEVSDTSSTAPHMRRARTYDEGGRGLLLVAQLTDRWGSRQTPDGKVIWAEQVLHAPTPEAAH
jgi:PAS domain S-box-containing protein